MFPPIEPFRTGILDHDGERLAWEATGSPEGDPVVFLHGGPGAGLGTGYRRWVDPQRSLLIGMHQRGTGASRPLADQALDRLPRNTTAALVADLEALRRELQIERWLVVGVSWGTTLALAYAQRHPGRTSGLVLAGFGPTTRETGEWMTDGVKYFFPEQWSQFEAASGRRPGERVLDAYARRLRDCDLADRRAAAAAWMAWEDAHVSLVPGASPMAGQDPDWDLTFATLVTHYWSHDAFLGPGELLAGMTRIAEIPGVIVHGRSDVSSPVWHAWQFHRAWPASELIVLDREGHGGASMADQAIGAIARLQRAE